MREEVIQIIRDNCKENPERLELIEVVAKELYEKGELEELKSNYSLTASLVYLAYRKIKIFKTLDEMATMFEVEPKEIGRMVKKIKRKLGMKYCKEASLMGQSCILQATPESFIDSIGKKLGISQETIQKSHNLYEEIKKDLGYFGSKPICISAGIVYIEALINDEKKTLREVADASGISEAAIRNNYKKIVNLMGIEYETELNDKKNKIRGIK